MIAILKTINSYNAIAILKNNQFLKRDRTLPQYKRDRRSQNNQFLQRDRLFNS